MQTDLAQNRSFNMDNYIQTRTFACLYQEKEGMYINSHSWIF